MKENLNTLPQFPDESFSLDFDTINPDKGDKLYDGRQPINTLPAWPGYKTLGATAFEHLAEQPLSPNMGWTAGSTTFQEKGESHPDGDEDED